MISQATFQFENTRLIGDIMKKQRIFKVVRDFGNNLVQKVLGFKYIYLFIYIILNIILNIFIIILIYYILINIY